MVAVIQAGLLTRHRSIYEAAFLPQQLPAEDITHLLYAFAGVADDGSVYVPSIVFWFGVHCVLTDSSSQHLDGSLGR